MQKIFKRTSRIWSFVGMVGSLLAFVMMLWTISTSAVVIQGSKTPQYINYTNPPSGFPASVWNPVVQFWPNGTPFMGAIIGTHSFITAKHVGGVVGDQVFSPYHEKIYGLSQGIFYTVGSTPHPTADLTVWYVNRPFNLTDSYAPLYSTTDPSEVGRGSVVWGAAYWQMDAEIYTGNFFNGWTAIPNSTPVNYTGIPSWGYSKVASIPSPGALQFDAFTPRNDLQSCHIGTGDSGGPIFIYDSSGAWKLAGINVSSDFVYKYHVSPSSTCYNMFLENEQGLLKTGTGGSCSIGDPAVPSHVPQFAAARIANYKAWIVQATW